MGSTHPLTSYREARGLKSADLARLLGESKTTVHRWESGARKIGREKLPSVAAKTGIPAKVLRPDLVEEAEKLLSEAAE